MGFLATHAHPAPTHGVQAIRLDEVAEGSLTSSMVDDVFFVLLKAGRRAMGTGKAPSVRALAMPQFRAFLGGWAWAGATACSS